MSFNAGVMKEIRVWLMTPVGIAGQSSQYVFPWVWGDWVESKRLIANSDTLQPGAMGHADFTLLRETISDNQASLNGRPFTSGEVNYPVTPGQYVAITAGKISEIVISNRLDPAAVLWWGFIDQIEGEQLAGTSEIVGSVKALGVGHLLDRMTARGWKRSGTTGYAESISLASPESANMGGPLDGVVLGNAGYQANDGQQRSKYLFMNDPSKCDATTLRLWTKWRLLDHFQTYCLNDEKIVAGVVWTLKCQDNSQAVDPAQPAPSPAVPSIASYLNSVAVPEVYPLRNQSCKGIIDLLAPRAQGIGWNIVLVDLGSGIVGWSIILYSLVDGGAWGLPSFSGTKQTPDLSLLPTVSFSRSKSSIDVPDEVVVEGNQIIFGVTASYIDGNVQAGWDQTVTTGQEQLFRDAAKNDSGYAALDRATQLDRNRSMRQSPALVDVFTRYNLKPDFTGATNGDLLRAVSTPGQSDASKPMCPSIGWDGTNLTFNETVTRCPYLPTANLARTLPWIEGFSKAGVDQRPVNMRAWPAFAKPRLFYFDVAKASNQQWVDLTARGGTRACPSLDVDDRGVSLRMQHDMAERMGLNIISLSTDGVYDLGQQLTTTEGQDIFDWRKCAFTFGIPSDQRVQYTIRRPGLTDSTKVRYSMKVTDEKLNCWIMHGGTILAIGANGLPDRIAGTGPSNAVIVRNDFARAQSRANQLAAFYFRARRGFTYVGMRPDVPPSWAYIGAAVGTIIETPANAATGTLEVSGSYETVVELVSHTYGDHPRVTISADLPQAPAMGGGAANPAAGGPISLSLNGTVAQATQQARQDIDKLKTAQRQAPLVMPFNPGPSQVANLYVLLGYNSLPGVGILGIQKRTDAVLGSEMPVGTGGTSGSIVVVVASPSLSGGLPLGVGIAQQITSSNYIWVINDSNCALSGDMGSGQKITTGGLTVTLDKVSGGVTYRYILQIPYFSS